MRDARCVYVKSVQDRKVQIAGNNDAIFYVDFNATRTLLGLKLIQMSVESRALHDVHCFHFVSKL